jgi:hypothetical protein
MTTLRTIFTTVAVTSAAVLGPASIASATPVVYKTAHAHKLVVSHRGGLLRALGRKVG